jgi:hypothetical protein
MANSNGWGDGSVNNNIAWGQGANNTIGWGKSHIDSWAGATDIDGGNLPSNSVAPAITGTAQEGQTLTCSTGTWSGSPTYTYQWKRNGNNITSATNSTYTLVSADVGQSIKCTVTATNFIGSATADSNTVTPISAFTGILDTYSGAAIAYSLRRLSSTYTGNLIRVRRSSDNTEQDIGYNSSNVLDTTALTTFVGAGNGFITTWYDQSGNGNNSTQSTAANQPRIINAGVVDLVNSKPALTLDGSNDALTLGSTITVNTNNYQSTVAKRSASSQNLVPLAHSATLRYLSGILNDNKYYFIGDSTGYTTTNSTYTTATQILLTQYKASSTRKTFVNQSDLATTLTTLTCLAEINNIGRYAGNYTNGNLQEVIFYNSDQSTNRTGIESNINTFYSIY